MNFKNNFSKNFLLTNKDVMFKSKEGLSFYLRIPTVFDVYFNEGFNAFISIASKDLKELSKLLGDNPVKSQFDFIRMVFTFSERRSELKELTELIFDGLKVCLKNIRYENQIFYVSEDIVLDRKLFDDIIEIIFTSLDKNTVVIKDTDDEFTRIEKEAALRAQRIRNSSKKEGESNNHSIENMFAAILYEFPQYKLEDVFELNIYTLNYLFKQIGKIANYEVNQLAYAFGNSKKFKYFIEK